MRTFHILTAATSILSLAFATPPTQLHEAGRCALRGTCGSTGGFFGSPLPCPDNEKAETPSDSLRTTLVDLCGPQWKNTDVCCDEDQVDALRSKLKQAQSIISSCPACKENFFNLFCTFTCSPDQSLFVNVTKTAPGDGDKLVINEIDNLWSHEYQSGFYDSCKDVKLGLTGGKAMDFLGNGAKTYQEFVKFLGDTKPLGSPFQINFIEKPRYEGQEGGMRPLDNIPKRCNDDDPTFRCTCVDCPVSCPELPVVKEAEHCHVGKLPCFSFAVVVIYAICLLLLVMAISGHVWYAKHKQRKSERLQLLQDAAPSDDEDEGDLVHNAGLLERPQKNYYLNQIFDRAFSKLGKFCANYPATTIGTNVLIIALLSLGWTNFEVERDPVRLWVSPTSAAAQEKAFFDSNFGPFYRAEQVFLVNDSTPNSTVVTYENLQWWLDIEQRLSRIKSQEYGLTLDDVCYNPTGDACVVLSVSGWFASTGGIDKYWKETFQKCAETPSDTECLPPFMKPLDPSEVLGGFHGVENVTHAKALTITWALKNYQPGTEGEKQAEDWEKMFKRELQMVQQGAADRGLRVSFNTERSLEEELNKSTNTDAKIVVVSYIVMFIYASLALGSGAITLRTLVSNPSNALVQSKFTLGVVGIVIVLMSVSGSVGLFSAAGIKVTLIIAEVIPFLVLAVGVDNIFLIVHEFERVNVSHPDEEIDDRIAKALGRMGPSILLSASTETVAFAMGCFVGMPAVKNFAAYAAGAVLINALLQVTMFISVLALNQRRVESLRADCFPCITVRRARTNNMPGGHFFGSDEEGFLQKFIRRTYAPSLLDKKIKTLVMTVFLTVFAAGLVLLPKIELGLDQRIALPSDSYMIPYFNDLYEYFGTGPPVYFVARDLNLTKRVHQKQVCGQFGVCDRYSLSTILEQESKRSNVSYIAQKSPTDWIDNFFTWLNPDLGEEACCIEENGERCFDGRWSYDLKDLPVGDEFISYAKRWITSDTTPNCPTGGKVLSDAVVIDANNTMIPASHFRTFHTPVQSQEDLINSYASARRIAKDISERHKIDIFPYSKHYIFFDQYSTIVQLTAALLSIGVVIVFLLTSVLLGSMKTGAVVSFTVIMILVDIMGVMALAHVSLNAISLVNLSICTGIGVEFCAHIARAFTYPSKNIMERARQKFRGKDLRAWTALVNVGGSVFSGITITKFLGVFVLAFTRSKIFEVYYFRIWLALVGFGAAHALIFLPVALSFLGGDGYIDPESDGGLEEDLASRRYRSLMPDDDYSDDD